MKPTPVIAWTRSSLCSADSPQCIEVATHADQVLVRDSKNPDPNGVLMFSREEWTAFVSGVENGDFAHI